MHDLLFSTQSTWANESDPTELFMELAGDLHLNTTDFGRCLDSGEMDEEIEDDMADGTASGIAGTPGFWIIGPNGQSKQISGAYPYATFAEAFDEML
jgi:protein-disulfide isomerase